MYEKLLNQEYAIKIDDAINNQDSREDLKTLSAELSNQAISHTGNGLDFRGMALSRKGYQGLVLPKSNLEEVPLHGTNFTGTDLKSSMFLASGCHRTVFDRSNLNQIKAHAQPFLTCSFLDASIQDVDWTGGLAHGCDFTGADLSHSDLSGTKLYESTFDRTLCKSTDLTGANFENSVIDTSDFTRANLINTEFLRCNIFQSIFILARLRGSSFKECSIIDCDFQDTNLYGAILTSIIQGGMIVVNPNLTNANLTTTKLKANIRNGKLPNVILSYTSFFGSRVNGQFTIAGLNNLSAIKSNFIGSGLSEEDFAYSDRNKF